MINRTGRVFSFQYKISVNPISIRLGIVLLVGGFISLSSLSAQTTLTGVVRDSLTQESLPFANVQSHDGKIGATADEAGYFKLQLPEPGSTDSFRITYVGYRMGNFALVPAAGTQPTVFSLAASSLLPTVEVTVPGSTFGPTAGVLTPSVAELKRTPVLFGEADPLKSLALLPGISSGSEGSAAINIRGGNPNQTDLLIDGNRIYNVNHIGGILSAVPTLGTKTVTVYKGGVPARYGGRLSGVVDITLREGRRDKLVKTFGIGFGTMQAALEGPVGKDKQGSFLVTGRYSYPSIINNLANSGSYEKLESGSHESISLYDFVGKYRRDLGRHVVTASAFISGDNGLTQNDRNFNLSADDFAWGNRSFTLKHQYRSPGGGVWSNSLQYLNYSYQFDRWVKPDDRSDREVTIAQRELSSSLNDVVATTEYAYGFNRHLDVYAGLYTAGHSFRTAIEDKFTTGELTQTFDRTIGQDSLEVALYASADVKLLRDRLQLMMGLRVSGLGLALPRNVEPRLRLSYNFYEGFYLNASYDHHFQYVHQLTPSISLYPNELYLLANDQFPAERSRQAAVGVGGLHGSLQWSVEAFHKRLDQLVRLNPGQERDADFVERFPQNVVGDGEGEVRGLEIYLKRTGEKFDYSIAYTLSRSDRRYDEVNEGRWFPFTFDRQHDLGITTSLAIGKKWRLNTAFIYQSGHRFTLPLASTAFFQVWGDYNDARLPAFNILNVSASKQWRGKRRANRHHELTFSLYNAYNRPNPYTLEFGNSWSQGIDPQTGLVTEVVSLEVVTLSAFPILPGVNYTVTIK
ncbi:TonB-dependent receptor [Neolewinella antarctica]|uniref:Outer membrane receptor for ferrienterochelin and colicin n=1 Tax=Neolewinella antarctica TaxID=442734 RepID=A0ABX0XB29_9BACT|nr:TonB-dependent receptor plug domain-containing protein [Neolewinella antarctica]NJC26476.1 outer membrane receptor for ferrienterochelin and colicin [Neolewinella antarctica]